MQPTPLHLPLAEDFHIVGERWRPATDTARSVVLAHGGGQTRHAWDRTAPTLAERGWEVVAYDMRGHGESAWHPHGHYEVDLLANDLVAVAAACTAPRPVLVGASVSGIAALLAATGEAGAARFGGIVLVDVAPTIDAGGVEKILGFMNAALDEGFADVEEAARAIAAYLPNRPPPRDLSGLAKNLRRHADGRLRWHWDPRFVRGPRWAGVQQHRPRLLAAAEALRIPTLMLRGRRSDLVTDAAVAEFLAHVPQARFRDVTDADHMIAGDRNDRFNACLLEFMDSLHAGGVGVA